MKTIGVVAAIIRDGNRIFATRRGYGAYKDWWEFPGGKIEDGEMPKEALVREIREELKTEIRVGDYIDTVLDAVPSLFKRIKLFLKVPLIRRAVSPQYSFWHRFFASNYVSPRGIFLQPSPTTIRLLTRISL